MFVKIVTFVFIALTIVSVFSEIEVSERRKCNRRYCSIYTSKNPCPLIKCLQNSTTLVIPELCRCCRSCYRLAGKSE